MRSAGWWKDLMLQGGVDQELVDGSFDGVGRAVRNGLNFTERGYGVRAGWAALTGEIRRSRN